MATTRSTHPPRARRQRLNESQRRAIGKRIRAVRLDRDLRQVELAHRAEIDQGSMNQIELGKRAPDLATLLRIAQVLEVPVSALLEARAVSTEGPYRDATRASSASPPVPSVHAAYAELVAALNATIYEWYEAHTRRTHPESPRQSDRVSGDHR